MLRIWYLYYFLVGQLEAVPTDFDDIEARACRRLFVGPYWWILPEVLKQLKAMHFPVELKCAKALSVAARSRVLRTENRQHGGLRVRERQRHLQAALDRCDDPSWAWAQQCVPNLSFYHLVRADDIAQATCSAFATSTQTMDGWSGWWGNDAE